MSKLLANKQIIHIITEIVVLIGITFYFSSKNKKLSSHIEDISQRLEDQEDLIQKHEQIIRQLVQAINSQNGTPKQSPHIQSTLGPKKGRPERGRSRKSKKTMSPPPPPVQSFEDNEEIDENEEYSSENDSDLDNEIAEEIAELQQQGGLKKRI